MRASALALLATTLAVAAPAFADTRIFSVETDQPGVTITAVSRDGQALQSTGTSGAKTFFTIDEGSEAVPCSNQLAFTASNGQRVEYVVDLCAHNWQVRLPLAAQAPAAPPSAPSPPPPSAGAPPPPPPPVAAAPSSITIYTDAAGIGIEEVFLDKRPVAIAGRNQAGVSIALPPGAGCERDLGLALSDGRRIARTVNVCQPNGVVVMALNGDGAAPPPGGPIASQPPPPPPPGGGAVPPAPPAPPGGGPIVIDNLQWSFDDDPNGPTLAYALPQSDNIEFFARCSRDSREIEISLERSSPETRPGAPVSVTITAGTFARTYDARGSEPGPDGESYPEFSTDLNDQLWPELIRGDYLVIQSGSAPAYALSLRGSSAAAKPFLAACAQGAGPPAQPPPGFPPGPAPMGGQVGGDYACAEEPTLRSQRSNLDTRLIFTNRLPFPVQLYWLDYNGRREPRLTLAPGETGVQPTFFTHPWLAADTSGRCLGIYFARREDFGVTIGQ